MQRREKPSGSSTNNHPDYDLSLCVSLLALFDFRGDKRVTRQDWIRGTRALNLHAMGEDDGLWTTLLSKYGLRSQEQQGAIDLRRIEDLVPIDPRISLLLKAMFSSVTTLSDDMLRAQGKLDSVESLRQNRVVINLRKRIQEPPFAAWRDLVQRHKELRMRTLKRTLQRGVVAALNQWADVARERKRMQRFGRRLLSRELMRAWTQWLDVLAGKARLERWLRRALNASLTKSWETWLDFLTARARQQRVLRRVMHVGKVKAWNQWCEAVETVNAQRALMTRTLQRALDAKLHAAWVKWTDLSAARRRMRNVMARLANAELSKAWNAWHTTLEGYETMRRVIQTALHQSIIKAWNTWLEDAEACAFQKQLLTSCFSRAMNRELLGALDKWKEMREDMRRLRRFGARLLSRHVAKAWASWSDLLENRRRMAKYGARLLKRSSLAAFLRWLEYNDEARMLRGALSKVLNTALLRAWNALVEHAGIMERMRAHAHRMLNVQVSRAFEGWEVFALAQQHNREVVMRAVHHQVAKAFNAWADDADAAARQTLLLGKAVGRMRNAQVAKAYDAWMQQYTERTRIKRYAGRLFARALVAAWYRWQEAADAMHINMSKMRRVGSRLMRRDLARGFARWAGEAESAREKLRVVRKFGMRMLRHGMAKAWESWMEIFEKRRLLRSFIGRIINHEMALAWEQWRGASADQLRLQKFARRLLKQHYARAWNQWIEVTREGVRMRTFGHKWLHNHVSRAFNTWYDWRIAAKRYIRTMRRLTRGTYYRAWNQWAEWAAEARQAARVMGRVAKRWQQADLNRVMRTWLEFVEEHHRKMGLLHTSAMRLSNLKKAQVFEAWLKVLHGIKARREDDMKTAINLMRTPLLTQTFYAWRSLIQQGKSAESQLQHALNMWGNRLLLQCFRAWESVSSETQVLRRKAVARFAAALLAKAFSAWRQSAVEKRENRGKARHTANLWQNRLLTLTFGAWRDYLERKHELLGESSTQWMHYAVARGFRRWKELSLEGTRLQQLGKRVLMRYTNALLSKCFDGWAALVQSEERRRGHVQQRAMATMSGRVEMLAQIALHAWHEWASAEGARRAELVAKMYGRYTHGIVAKTFLAWQRLYFEAHAAQRGKILTALHFIAAKEEVTKRMVLETWHKFLGERKSEREERVLFALRRIHSGMLHVCFHAWLELLPSRTAGGAGADEPESERVKQLTREVSDLRLHLAELSKQVATQERTKAYRYELSLTREELHSFLFRGAPPPRPQAELLSLPPEVLQQTHPLVLSHSQSDDSDDEHGAPAGSPASASHGGGLHSPVVGSRPRSGGPTGSKSREQIASGAALSRPSSARGAFHVPATPAPHEWPFKPAPPGYPPVRQPPWMPADPNLMATAAGAAGSAALRAKPPSGNRPRTADARGRSPRVRNLAAPEPHFTCSTITPISQPSGGVGGVDGGAAGASASGLAWAQRSHFSQLPPVPSRTGVPAMRPDMV